jgi:outer membrane receptor protein involved in Fe transport
MKGWWMFAQTVRAGYGFATAAALSMGQATIPVAASGLAAIGILAPGLVRADDGATGFPAAPLAETLRHITDRYGVSIGSDGALPAIMTRPVTRARNAVDALARALQGSGWQAQRIGPGLWRIVAAARQTPAARPDLPRSDLPRSVPLLAALPVAAQVQDDIVVSADKSSARLALVPHAVSVLRFGLDDQNFPSSASAAVARDTDGLVLTALGAGNNRMFLRAVADSPFNGSSQSPVAVLVDGGRLTYSAPDPDLRLVDVDRVELLKGPQGSLYGTGVLGGIYQVVARPAQLDRIEAMASAGGTASTRGAAGPAGSAMLNLPLVHDAAGLRLVGYGERQPGWITTGTRANANRTGVAGARGDLGIEPAPGWRIDLTGLAQRIRADDSQYVYATGTLARPDQQAEPHLTEIAHAGLRLSGTIGAVRIDALGGYTWHHLRAALDATVGAAALASALGVDSPGLFTDDRQFRVWEGELRLSGRVAGVRWLIGAAHTESREQGRRSLTASFAGALGRGGAGSDSASPNAVLHPDAAVIGVTEDVAVDQSQRNAIDSGVFGTIVVPIAPHLDIEGGARFYVSVLDVQRTVEEASGHERTAKRGISPAGALTWHPHTGRLVWLRYDRAFRQGGLTFGEDGRVTAFAGDRLDTLEAGWRETRGGLTVNAGGYLTWWNDMQADTLQSTGLIETQNVGRARIEGGELGLTLAMPDTWQIGLGATLQHARLIDAASAIALAGARLPMIPDYTLRAGLERGFGLLGGQGHLRASLRWLGPARLSFDPRLDQPTGNVLETALAASLRWGATCLSLMIDNPVDRSGNAFAYGNPFRIAAHQVTPQAPVRATAMITVRF